MRHLAARVTEQTEALRALSGSGITLAEAADKIGISYWLAGRHARVAGIKFPHASIKPAGQRELQMAALFRSGKTLQQIGDAYGVTRERVRQLLEKAGIEASEGGACLRNSKVRISRKLALEQKEMKRTGCALDCLRELRSIGRQMMLAGQSRGKTPIGAFNSQRANAHRRRIAWQLSLFEWWTIWQSSGHWKDRGVGHGYVMCRNGDLGPYAVGNVFIATARENNSETSRKRSGLPMGVHEVVRGNYHAFVAVACVRGKVRHLGSFKTPDAAHARYLMEIESSRVDASTVIASIGPRAEIAA